MTPEKAAKILDRFIIGFFVLAIIGAWISGPSHDGSYDPCDYAPDYNCY